MMSIMTLRLDDLDYFLAVAERGTVRAAALDLGVSQPAVTQGLHRLEAELGFPLFVRSAKGMQLTDPATQFRARTQLLRTNLKSAIREAADLHLGEQGILQVGVSPLYVKRLFSPAAIVFCRQRPAARLRVMINLNDALIAALEAGEIDVSLSALPTVVPDGLQATPLIEDTLCLVVRQGHPLLSRRQLRLRDLTAAQWLLPGPAVAVRRSVEGRFAEAGLPPPHVTVELSNTAWGQLNALVVNSDLISIMSESMLHGPNGEGLVPLPLNAARFPRPVGILVRRDGVIPPLTQRFVELLKAQKAGDAPPV